MVKAGYKQTEIGEIPEDWEVKPIAKICPLQRGFDLPTRLISGGDFPVAYSNGVQNYHSKYMSNGPGVYTGRSGTIGKVNYINENYWPHNTTLWVTDFKGNIPKYTYYLLSSLDLIKYASGSGVPTLNRNDVHDSLVSMPKPDEQKAIADALSDVDALIASLEKLIEKKRDIKTATMQQLLTGKKRLQGFHKEWQIRKIEELADIDPENLSSTTNPLYEFRYVSLEDVDSGRLRGHSEQNFSTSPSRARRILRMNDVVIATVRPNLKSHFLFQRNEKDWICSTGFAVIRCNPKKADAQFLFYQFFARQIELQIETLIAGSNYPAINSGDVRKLEISCPETDEQAAIASVISDMDKELHVLEEKLSKAKAIKQGMMQELLTGRTRLV